MNVCYNFCLSVLYAFSTRELYNMADIFHIVLPSSVAIGFVYLEANCYLNQIAVFGGKIRNKIILWEHCSEFFLAVCLQCPYSK